MVPRSLADTLLPEQMNAAGGLRAVLWQRQRALARRLGAGLRAYPVALLEFRAGVLPSRLDAASTATVVVVWFAFAYVCYRWPATSPGCRRQSGGIRRSRCTRRSGPSWQCCGSSRQQPIRGVLQGVVVVLPVVLWRCGYLLLSGQRGRVVGTRLRDHLVHLFPVWGGGNVPYGKGSEYLARHEATSSEALARSRLAGLHLLGLALLWTGTLVVVRGLVYDEPGNPVTRVLGGSDPRASRAFRT